jgi:hypothetical protein
MTKKTTTGTAITPHQRAVLAAVMGGTNLGMSNPEKKLIDKMIVSCKDLDQMIYYLWSGYMENDEIEKSFTTECRWWFRSRDNLNSKKVTVEYVRRIWPDIADLVFGLEVVS